MAKKITKKVKVGIVQIGEMFGDQYYLPYSIALLQAYAQNNLTHPEDFVFSLPIYKSIKIEKAVEYFSDADIVFFSVYIWNYEISLEMAKHIKQNKNDCIIAFGGPQVPERTTRMEMFLVVRKLNEYLSDKNISVYSTEVGEFCTSQEMAGISITLIKLDNEIKRYYNMSADSPGYRKL